MKTILLSALLALSASFTGQTVKSKALKIKYTLPAGWNASEFGGKNSWEEEGNNLCHCSGIHFTRSHGDGKLNVLLYPSTQSGLDSSKRNAVGNLRFEDVVKYDRVRNKDLSYERKKSNFKDAKTGEKSYEVFRYFAKADDHFYIIYAWQENMQTLNSSNEKLLFEMINAIEAN